ncbi:hypothetical protein [Pseudomonas sp. RIT-To-2]|uniref:hypothetical protein n=1 Tax=Pseudomonas sp. RIT-To-2 TaxID=3462541 RepID=UPI0024137CEF
MRTDLRTSGSPLCSAWRSAGKAERFSEMLSLPSETLDSVNLKEILVEKFDAPTIGVNQSIRACAFTPEICAMLEVEDGSFGMVLELTAETLGMARLSFQRIHILETE